MSKITNLENKNEEIVYPITVTDAVVMSDKTTKIEDAIAAKATINVSDTDIGEGATLTSGEFMAIYGEGGQVQTAEIADGAVTTAKLASNSVTAAKIGADVAFIDADGTTESEDPWVNVSMLVWSGIMDKIYPVGSIYMSATLSTAAQVGATLGGTWVAWGSGRVPVGVDTDNTSFDTVEETGGSLTHAHDFKIGLAQYYGGVYGDTLSNYGAYSYAQSKYSKSYGRGDTITFLRNNSFTAGTTSISDPIRYSVGDTDSTSTLQPYITCYMYKRTA